MLFGDGSVRFVSAFISGDTWWALSTMNVGDVPQLTGDDCTADDKIATTKRLALAAAAGGLLLLVCWFVWWGAAADRARPGGR